jgi:hypothetical protein
MPISKQQLAIIMAEKNKGKPQLPKLPKMKAGGFALPKAPGVPKTKRYYGESI